MNKIKQSVMVLFSINCLLVTTSVNAIGPGYVSRDCPTFGAKESITVDWLIRDHWFQTHSMHAFPVNGDNSRISWKPHLSKPKPGARGGWDETWHSYAGSIFNYPVNNFYSRVVGYHLWFNVDTRQIETRKSDVQGCNLSIWGLGNWENQKRSNWDKRAYAGVLEWF
ncbi:MAG: hypothetical protein L3J00_05155 [Thiomicrorhabdus sp.]|nr:hypothetical protein [Thiomicrorhabdus sp.]